MPRPGVEKVQRDRSPVTVMVKSKLGWGKIILISCQLQICVVRSKGKLKQDVPPSSPPSSQVQIQFFIPDSSPSPHPKWCSRMGMRGLCYSFLLTLFLPAACVLPLLCHADSLFICMFLCSLLWALYFNCFVKEPDI